MNERGICASCHYDFPSDGLQGASVIPNSTHKRKNTARFQKRVIELQAAVAIARFAEEASVKSKGCCVRERIPPLQTVIEEGFAGISIPASQIGISPLAELWSRKL